MPHRSRSRSRGILRRSIMTTVRSQVLPRKLFLEIVRGGIPKTPGLCTAQLGIIVDGILTTISLAVTAATTAFSVISLIHLPNIFCLLLGRRRKLDHFLLQLTQLGGSPTSTSRATIRPIVSCPCLCVAEKLLCFFSTRVVLPSRGW